MKDSSLYYLCRWTMLVNWATRPCSVLLLGNCDKAIFPTLLLLLKHLWGLSDVGARGLKAVAFAKAAFSALWTPNSLWCAKTVKQLLLLLAESAGSPTSQSSSLWWVCFDAWPAWFPCVYILCYKSLVGCFKWLHYQIVQIPYWIVTSVLLKGNEKGHVFL